MNGRTKLIAGGVAAGGFMLIGGALVVGAGIARADVDGYAYGGGSMGDRDAYSYWNQTDGLGVSATVADAQHFAGTVCDQRAAGVSEGKLVSWAADGGFDTVVARLVVHGAEFHFCPTYY
jgi:hypothetical protein